MGAEWNSKCGKLDPKALHHSEPWRPHSATAHGPLGAEDVHAAVASSKTVDHNKFKCNQPRRRTGIMCRQCVVRCVIACVCRSSIAEAISLIHAQLVWLFASIFRLSRAKLRLCESSESQQVACCQLATIT